MTQNWKQRGDATTLLFAVLTIGLIAAVGVIFYQSYSSQKSEQARNDAKNSQKIDKDPTITTDAAFSSTIYQLDHPASWTVTTAKKTISNQGGTVISIVNSDKTMRVELNVSEVDQPVKCDQTPGLKVKMYDVSSQPVVTKLGKSALYLVAAIYDHAESGYDYAVGLTPDNGASHADVGDPRCNVDQIGRVSNVLRDKETNELLTPTIDARIVFTKLREAPKAASYDIQGIKKYLESDDYATATSIIESARTK